VKGFEINTSSSQGNIMSFYWTSKRILHLVNCISSNVQMHFRSVDDYITDLFNDWEAYVPAVVMDRLKQPVLRYSIFAAISLRLSWLFHCIDL
jgi:hypothetical protein